METSTSSSLFNCGDGRHLTGFAWQLHCVPQFYLKFIEWADSPKEWFGDAVEYQLRTLASIIKNGSMDEGLDAAHLHTLCSKFSNLQNISQCQK